MKITINNFLKGLMLSVFQKNICQGRCRLNKHFAQIAKSLIFISLIYKIVKPFSLQMCYAIPSLKFMLLISRKWILLVWYVCMVWLRYCSLHLIGPNKNYLIITKNKLSLTNFKEKFIYYIAVQNNYLFPCIA